MSKVVGIIPARWGSTRFPGKILADIAGKPLIQWVWERASQASALSAVIVATDEQRIADVVADFGGTAVMTRADHPSGTDRIAEAVRDLDAEAVINVQGDEPLIAPALIDELATVITGPDQWDMATAAARITDPAEVEQPSVVKVVCAADGKALYFSRSPIPHWREKNGDGSGEPLYLRHIGIYAYRRAFLQHLVQTPPTMLEEAEKLEQLRALYLGARMKVLVTEHSALGVDEPGDVERAEQALKEAGLTQ